MNNELNEKHEQAKKKIKIIAIFIFFEQFGKTVVISHVEILPVIKPRTF